jgi:hypothetical protein
MTLKSLLFGSAAIIAAGTGAQAADLPTAEPVEYVRICDAFGAGFYYIPGSDTCLRVGGYVRADFTYVDFPDNDDVFDHREVNNYATRARGALILDARTNSDFGTVRAYAQLEMNVGNVGLFSGDGSFGSPNYSGTDPGLDQAYISITNDWGTVNFGRLASQFDFYGSTTFGTRLGIDDNTGKQNQVSFIGTFGGGFSFALSLEDAASGGRRKDGGDTGFVFDADGAGPILPVLFADTASYEGQEMPDLVAALGLSQGWGSARLSGVLHHIHDKEGYEGGPFGPFANAEGEEDDDALGWAVLAGVKANILGFGAAIEAGYADGAIGYITNDFGGFGDFTESGPDGDNDTNTAWMVRGGIQAGFTDTVSANIDASYTNVDRGGDDDDDDGAFDAFDDDSYDVWAVAANVVWTPVSGLSMGPEVAYRNIDFDLGDDDLDDADEGDFDVWGVMFRVNRDF